MPNNNNIALLVYIMLLLITITIVIAYHGVKSYRDFACAYKIAFPRKEYFRNFEFPLLKDRSYMGKA